MRTRLLSGAHPVLPAGFPAAGFSAAASVPVFVPAAPPGHVGGAEPGTAVAPAGTPPGTRAHPARRGKGTWAARTGGTVPPR
ncbi:hypothetical protein [Streptomyces griseoloalbus]|uniref:Uncharacterized protein n=1 Tax=Streptomyces griseoloalbus TaxID=67303 RepID=A0A7W8BJD7_9ACTN|nr:hypothetical protein [Streptomyces albaduncus]MBB5123818.1 hypothetical protein [Streptomyces albaduncus]GGW41610.1 hypothetical protein GCM10010340_19570 [Streptomyces albaduncus]